MFSVLFEKRLSHQMSSWENNVWIQSDRAGDEVVFFSNLIAVVENAV